MFRRCVSVLRIPILTLAAGALLDASWAARPAVAQQDDPPPPGVQQLLPRNGIPSIFEPQFVPADEADIPDDAWILGVAIDGEARAYSLNLLNGHEIVNDHVGGRPVAAVW